MSIISANTQILVYKCDSQKRIFSSMYDKNHYSGMQENYWIGQQVSKLNINVNLS